MKHLVAIRGSDAAQTGYWVGAEAANECCGDSALVVWIFKILPDISLAQMRSNLQRK